LEIDPMSDLRTSLLKNLVGLREKRRGREVQRY
jgi:hypothetical protein